MNLNDIATQCFILALFIRDDGQRFLLGCGAYEFKQSQLHFAPNTFANDIIEVQGNDGVLLAGQVRRASTQTFEGYIGDATVTKPQIEQYRTNFLAFFRKNHFYTVVYIFNDGTAIQRRRGFIVDAPKVQELFQFFPEYHIGLSFEDVNYYSYSEDSEGHETYIQRSNIPLETGTSTGGLVWNSLTTNPGAVWANNGALWMAGSSSGAVIIQVNSIDDVFPVWTVTGNVVNPTLANLTTNTTLIYNGTVISSQTLVVDMLSKTATLNGTSVVGNIGGDWINLASGNNRMTYTANSASAPDSQLEWQEIVG